MLKLRTLAAMPTLPVPYGLIPYPINPITPKVDISALKKKLGVESRALKASHDKADLT
jgi:hypothetical protein